MASNITIIITIILKEHRGVYKENKPNALGPWRKFTEKSFEIYRWNELELNKCNTE